MKTTKLFTLATALAYTLFLSACLPTNDQDHDHAGHDHDHDHGKKETKPAAQPATTDVATDAAIANAKPYPLDVCIVGGEKLGSMGKPASLVHEGQLVKFCCEGCIDDFKAEPAKYLAKLTKK